MYILTGFSLPETCPEATQFSVGWSVRLQKTENRNKFWVKFLAIKTKNPHFPISSYFFLTKKCPPCVPGNAAVCRDLHLSPRFFWRTPPRPPHSTEVRPSWKLQGFYNLRVHGNRNWWKGQGQKSNCIGHETQLGL